MLLDLKGSKMLVVPGLRDAQLSAKSLLLVNIFAFRPVAGHGEVYALLGRYKPFMTLEFQSHETITYLDPLMLSCKPAGSQRN